MSCYLDFSILIIHFFCYPVMTYFSLLPLYSKCSFSYPMSSLFLLSFLSLPFSLVSYFFFTLTLYLSSTFTSRGDDTSGEARLRSDWNNHVMKDIVSPLYALLLVYACKYLQELALTTTASIENAPSECSTISEVPILFDLILRTTYNIPYLTYHFKVFLLTYSVFYFLPLHSALRRTAFFPFSPVPHPQIAGRQYQSLYSLF